MIALTGKMAKIRCNISILSLLNSVIIDHVDLHIFQFNIDSVNCPHLCHFKRFQFSQLFQEEVQRLDECFSPNSFIKTVVNNRSHGKLTSIKTITVFASI